MEKKFIKYLLDIGFIEKKSSIQILSQYNSYDNHEKTKNKFNQKMTDILITFFEQISDIQKKYICFTLPAKFIKINNQNIKNKLKSLILKNELKNKFIILKYLFKWYRFLHKNEKNNIIVNNFNKNQIYRHNSYNTMKSNKNKNNINPSNNKIYNYMREFIHNSNNLSPRDIYNKYDKKTNNYINNLVKKEKYINKNLDINLNDNNIEDNTFYGTIKNENIKKMYINNNRISKLIKNYNLLNKKMKNIDFNNITDLIDTTGSNENYINSSDQNDKNKYKKNKNLSNFLNIKTNNSNINITNMNPVNSPSTSKNSNLSTNYNYKPKYNNNIYNLIYCNNYNNLNTDYISKNEDFDLFTEKTPFCDKELKSLKNQDSSPGKRLYEKGLKKIKHRKYLETLSHKENKIVNYKHINSLYSNEKKSKTLEKVKQKVEKEEGLTFKPKICKSVYTNRINSDFYERNYSHPNKNNKDNEEDKNNKSYRNQNMNKTEKENIINGIIDRLYKNKKANNEDSSQNCKKYSIKGLTTIGYLKGYKKKL